MTALPAPDGFLFGCDPEMFVTNAEGELVSAAGLFPGTKKEPHKVERGAVQVDGMAAEINPDPAGDFETFNGNIVATMRQLKGLLPKGYGLKIVPAVRFSQQVMDAQNDETKVLGCDPDFNAWTGDVNPYPDTSADPLLRTASGHTAIGWLEPADFMPVTDELHIKHCKDLVKQLDWFLGAPSVQKDSDVTRRQLYGKAGAFRPKPFGVEYRVLSNFWLVSKELRKFVWNRMVEAILHMKQNELAVGTYKKFNTEVQGIINTGKTDHPLFYSLSWPLMRI